MYGKCSTCSRQLINCKNDTSERTRVSGISANQSTVWDVCAFWTPTTTQIGEVSKYCFCRALLARVLCNTVTYTAYFKILQVSKIAILIFWTISIGMATFSVRLSGALFTRQWHFTCSPRAYRWPTWSCQPAWSDVEILLTLTSSQKQESRWENRYTRFGVTPQTLGERPLLRKGLSICVKEMVVFSSWGMKVNLSCQPGLFIFTRAFFSINTFTWPARQRVLHSDTAAWASTGW